MRITKRVALFFVLWHDSAMNKKTPPQPTGSLRLPLEIWRKLRKILDKTGKQALIHFIEREFKKL